MLLVNQIEWKPCKYEIQWVTGTETAGGRGPENGFSQDVHYVRGSGSGMCVPVFVRPPISPRGQPQQADQTDPEEDRTPAIPCDQQPGAKGSRHRPKLHARDDCAVGEAAVFLRQVQSEYFRIARERYRLDNAEEQAHHQEHRESMNYTGCRGCQ